jgi:CopG family transcriptional regulator, nickel-responsive regulator
MERITVAVDDALAAAFDELTARRGYTSRSEAMRDLMRREVDVARTSASPKGQCVAALSYVYAHHVRDLAERINAAQHDHHDLVISSLHVHLDHEHCLESVFLKGRLDAVRAFADWVGAERGVQHCQLNVIVVDVGDGHRPPGRYHHHHGHLHLVPRD